MFSVEVCCEQLGLLLIKIEKKISIENLVKDFINFCY